MDFLLAYMLFHCCVSACMWRIIFINLVFIELIYLCSLFSRIVQSQNKYLTMQKDSLLFLPVVAPLTSTFLASRSTVKYPCSLRAVPCFTNSLTDTSVMPGSSDGAVIYQPSEILAVPTGWGAWQKYNCSYSLYGHKPNRSRIEGTKIWEGLG